MVVGWIGRLKFMYVHNYTWNRWLVLRLHCAYLLSCVWLLATPWALAHQAPLSVDRQEYWSGLPSPPPGDHPDPRIKPRSPAFQADSLLSEPPRKPMNTGIVSLSLSRISSQPRNQTKFSCTAGRFFTAEVPGLVRVYCTEHGDKGNNLFVFKLTLKMHYNVQ